MVKQLKEEMKIKILGNLLEEPQPSLYKLAQLVFKDIKTKSASLPQVTVLNYVKKSLEPEGLVSIKETGLRGAFQVSITNKGAFYLMLKGALTNAELAMVFSRIQPGLTVTETDIQKLVNKLKPRVNLDFFDEKIAIETLLLIIFSWVVDNGSSIVKKTDTRQFSAAAWETSDKAVDVWEREARLKMSIVKRYRKNRRALKSGRIIL